MSAVGESQLEMVLAPSAVKDGLRVLQHEYVFDHRIANCDGCALLPRREMTECLSERPEKWNGLMVIGEGPGTVESRLKRPFLGPSGQLLDLLLSKAGLDRAETYITNAALCMPGAAPGSNAKYDKKTKKDADVASGTQHCRSRLLQEISFYQPRVILALGQQALDAVTGNENRIDKRVKFDCPQCQNANKWKVWRCAKCKTPFHDKYVLETPGVKAVPPAEETPCCQAKWQPFIVRCEGCGGLKTRVSTEYRWQSAYKIGEVAGGVFTASTLPIASALKDPEHTYVIPTYHPSFLKRAADTKSQKMVGGQFLAWAALLHIQKAHRLLHSDPIFPFRWKLYGDPVELDAYWADTSVAYSVDIETDAKDPLEVTDIRCISVNREDSDESAVIDTSQLPASHPLVAAVCDFLRDPRRRKIMQNGIYDCTVMKRVWQVQVQGHDEDTLIGHNVLSTDEPHDLAHIAFLYTDAPPWKPPKASKKGGFVFESKEQLYEYNGRDTRTTTLSMKAIRLELDREGARHVHALDMKKVKLAQSMTEVGMPVDRRRMLELGMEAQYELEQATFEMRKMVGRIPDRLVAKDAGADAEAFALKPTQPKHLVWALFSPEGPFHLMPTKFNEKSKTDEWPLGTPSTEKGALVAHASHPFVEQIIRFKANHYVKANLVDGNALGTDMRMHPVWNPVRAKTGRWSSSPNWQNIKRKYRYMIAAPPGRRIVGADAAQLELRISAALSGDPDLLHLCINADEKRKLEPEFDPHSYTASRAFGATFTTLSLDDPYHRLLPNGKSDPKCSCQTCTRKQLREIAKRVVYGLNYGAGAETIRESIYDGGYDGPFIELETIDNVIRNFFLAFPKVAEWREKTLAEAQRTGYVRDAILNRFRAFPLGEVEATVAMNYPIQSSAASLMDIGILDLHRRLPSADPSAFIFAQVHDAVYIECDEKLVQPVSELTTECMSCEIRFHDDAVFMPLPATAHDGADWLEAA